MYPSVPTSTVYNSQDMKTTKMTTGRQMNKEDVEYIYIYIYIQQNITHKRVKYCYFQQHGWI